MRTLYFVLLLMIISQKSNAQAWQIGIRSGIVMFHRIVPDVKIDHSSNFQSSPNALQNEIYARKDKGRVALDYSISYYRSSIRYSGYAFVFDAPSYFYSNVIAVNHINLGFSLQYDLLPVFTRKSSITSKTSCHLGLNVGIEPRLFDNMETHVLDEDGKPIRTMSYKHYNIYGGIGSVLYISHAINRNLWLNASSAFNINNPLLLGSILNDHPYDNINSHFNFKLGLDINYSSTWNIASSRSNVYL